MNGLEKYPVRMFRRALEKQGYDIEEWDTNASSVSVTLAKKGRTKTFMFTRKNAHENSDMLKKYIAAFFR